MTSVRQPVFVAYGGGVNSTALILLRLQRSEPIDLILFSDTHAEHPETYAYISMFDLWLRAQGATGITIVQTSGKSLEQDCIDRQTLPSKAIGMSTCSQRFKIEPQAKFINNWQPAIDCWSAGGKVLKLVGFDADEPHRAKFFDDAKFRVEYPLIENDMGRAECRALIESAGLPIPPKSSCFFCPSMKRHEILALNEDHPDLMKRALAMENGNRLLVHVEGLGRNFAWGKLIKMDHDQYKFIPNNSIEIDCACYDEAG